MKTKKQICDEICYYKFHPTYRYDPVAKEIDGNYLNQSDIDKLKQFIDDLKKLGNLTEEEDAFLEKAAYYLEKEKYYGRTFSLLRIICKCDT